MYKGCVSIGCVEEKALTLTVARLYGRKEQSLDKWGGEQQEDAWKKYQYSSISEGFF